MKFHNSSPFSFDLADRSDGESSGTICRRLESARNVQQERFKGSRENHISEAIQYRSLDRKTG